MNADADGHTSADTTWLVLVNDLGQHTLWPAVRPVPEGWSEVGPEGSVEACVEWVDANWADMRPRALVTR